MENSINCYYRYTFSQKVKECYIRILISDSNKIIFKKKSYIYRQDEYLARDIGIKKLFRVIERMEREGNISCEDKITIFIDDEILYKQFLTENGFDSVGFHRKDRLIDLSKRLKSHENWTINYDPEAYNKLNQLLIHAKEAKEYSSREKSHNNSTHKSKGQKLIRKVSDLIIEGLNNIIFFDIEMNCNAKKNNKYELWEAISIGAVKYNIKDKSIEKFHSLIKPCNNSMLSERCIELTNIIQNQIDNAESFKMVMLDFEKWIGHEKSIFVSWGIEDIRVVINDNKRNGFRLQIVNHMRKNYIDFQKEFCSQHLKSQKLMSLTSALSAFNEDFIGIKHNALDDAFNLFKVYMCVIKCST